ncbi:MAG: hypothetical protein NVS9B15_03940 [Acidobacteriaceae bacterium]
MRLHRRQIAISLVLSPGDPESLCDFAPNLQAAPFFRAVPLYQWPWPEWPSRNNRYVCRELCVTTQVNLSREPG